MATVDDLVKQARRPAGELTRRDVARALLTVPADQARASLPDLRRALTAAGNPLSQPFWERAEELLDLIATGQATVGDVHQWLEDTGTEPSKMLPAGLFVWPDEGERGPVAEQLHAELVTHLEEQVAAGRIDPDRLVAGDREAREDYVAIQEQWLREPGPDGTERLWMVEDEEAEAFLAAWDEVDAAAAEQLGEILAEVGERPCPQPALQAVCDRLRAQLRDGDHPYDLLARAGGVDPGDPPADDVELWLTLAAGTVVPVDEPPPDADIEVLSAWYALQHADWLGAVATLARSGPGTPASADDLAEYALSSPDVGGEYEDDDPFTPISMGFLTVEPLWQALDAIDRDSQLTPLGWWGLPEAVVRAWVGPPDEH